MKKLTDFFGWPIPIALFELLPSLIGALMATIGIRYYQGDRELARWVTSLGPAKGLAGPFIIIGFLLMGGPVAVFLWAIFHERFEFGDFKFTLHSQSQKITLLAVYILLIAITAWLIKVFDLRGFQLFWSR